MSALDTTILPWFNESLITAWEQGLISDNLSIREMALASIRAFSKDFAVRKHTITYLLDSLSSDNATHRQCAFVALQYLDQSLLWQQPIFKAQLIKCIKTHEQPPTQVLALRLLASTQGIMDIFDNAMQEAVKWAWFSWNYEVHKKAQAVLDVMEYTVNEEGQWINICIRSLKYDNLRAFDKKPPAPYNQNEVVDRSCEKTINHLKDALFKVAMVKSAWLSALRRIDNHLNLSAWFVFYKLANVAIKDPECFHIFLAIFKKNNLDNAIDYMLSRIISQLEKETVKSKIFNDSTVKNSLLSTLEKFNNDQLNSNQQLGHRDFQILLKLDSNDILSDCRLKNFLVSALKSEKQLCNQVLQILSNLGNIILENEDLQEGLLNCLKTCLKSNNESIQYGKIGNIFKVLKKLGKNLFLKNRNKALKEALMMGIEDKNAGVRKQAFGVLSNLGVDILAECNKNLKELLSVGLNDESSCFCKSLVYEISCFDNNKLKNDHEIFNKFKKVLLTNEDTFLFKIS